MTLLRAGGQKSCRTRQRPSQCEGARAMVPSTSIPATAIKSCVRRCASTNQRADKEAIYPATRQTAPRRGDHHTQVQLLADTLAKPLILFTDGMKPPPEEPPAAESWRMVIVG